VRALSPFQNDHLICITIGTRRVSDAKKKKAAAKGGPKRVASKASVISENDNGNLNGFVDTMEQLELGDRSCTGVLSSHPQSRDIHIDSFTLLFHGHELLQDCRLELNYGRYIACIMVAN
jgi:ATP-binding cassette subfamily F protein 2